MKVAVIGTGYVGLGTAALLAHIGHTVTGIDISQDKIDLLRAGQVPIHEPGLDDLLASVQGCLTWTTSYDSVHEADVIFAGNRASPGQAVSCARSAFRKPVNFLWDKMALSGPRRLSDFHAPADLRGVALLPRPHLS